MNPHGRGTGSEIDRVVARNKAVEREARGYRASRCWSAQVVVAWFKDCTKGRAAMRWARRMLEPGAAVVLDTETTDLDGSIIELAVIDAHTGGVLVDTLVDPDRPISSDAALVHGLTGSDVAGAPTWPQVLPRLLEATKGRTILAYNAEFDHKIIVGDCHRYGLDPAHLADPANWGCVMGRRSDWLRASRRLGLGGARRALGDTRAALNVLWDMTRPRPRPRRARRPLTGDAPMTTTLVTRLRAGARGSTPPRQEDRQ